jgi:hypothetical protein
VSKRFLCLLGCLCVVLVGCNDETDTTIIDLSDCGLVAGDLITDWTVQFTGNTSSTTVGCDVTASNNRTVDVDNVPDAYTGVFVTAAPESPSYFVEGDLGDLAPGGPELKAAVSVDTCIALVQVWEEDDQAFVQCIGELDRNSGIIQADCDAAEVDANEDGNPDATCGLTTLIQATVSLAP